MSNIQFNKDPIIFATFFSNKFAELSNNKYSIELGNINKIHKEYYEVYESTKKEKWQNCRFHLEIRWGKEIPLQETKKVRVVVHVERSCDTKEPELTERIRSAFSEQLQRNTIIAMPVSVDFSTSESTEASIKSILKVIDCSEFQSVLSRAKEIIETE